MTRPVSTASLSWGFASPPPSPSPPHDHRILLSSRAVLNDPDSPQGEIGDIEKVSEVICNCEALFTDWKTLTVDEKTDLAKWLVGLVTTYNDLVPIQRARTDGYAYTQVKPIPIPNANVETALHELLETGEYRHEVRTLLDQYRQEVPRFSVKDRTITDASLFVAKWYLRLLMTENDPNRIQSSVPYVNQLTLHGIFDPGIGPVTVLNKTVILVFTCGLILPVWVHRYLKSRKITTIRREYLRFLDRNGYRAEKQALRGAASVAKRAYANYLTTELCHGF